MTTTFAHKPLPRRMAALAMLALSLAACNSAAQATQPVITPQPSTPSATPTQTQPPPEPLTICLNEEPNTLYPLGDLNPAAELVLQALYDGPIDRRNYGYQPVILEKIPSLADGDATLETVTVKDGDVVVDAEGNPSILRPGLLVRPAGCQGDDCAVYYPGGDFEMDQLVVTFMLLPDLTWSNGELLTAHDSVFAYNLNAHPDTPASKDKVQRTASYTAVDDLTVEWRGRPGFLDKDYMASFWTPLPAHLWEGTQPGKLASRQESAEAPIGYGPYLLEAWEKGEAITLSANPNYFRAEEGLPLMNSLIFRFVEGAQNQIDALLAGECDLLDPTLDWSASAERLLELQALGKVQLSFANNGVWEHLDFGILPTEYDDGYQPGVDRPDLFGDPLTRQGIAYCLDRQALVDALAYGQPAIMDTYAPPGHPALDPEAAQYPFDPQTGSQLLEEAGWVMGSGGLRVARGVVGVPEGTPLEMDYFTTDSANHQTIAEILRRGLDNCGVQVNVQTSPAEALFASGPEGPLFGRRFDLAQFSWPFADEPACYLYMGTAIPGADLDTFPYSWGGWNLTGWQNEDFDAACNLARSLLPGQEGYLESQWLAQQIFAEELPMIPLFAYQKIAIARPDFCGFALDPTAGALWNVEAFGFGDLCTADSQ